MVSKPHHEETEHDPNDAITPYRQRGIEIESLNGNQVIGVDDLESEIGQALTRSGEPGRHGGKHKAKFREGIDVGKNEYLRTNSQDESAGHGSGDTKKLLPA